MKYATKLLTYGFYNLSTKKMIRVQNITKVYRMQFIYKSIKNYTLKII